MTILLTGSKLSWTESWPSHLGILSVGVRGQGEIVLMVLVSWDDQELLANFGFLMNRRI